MKNRTKKIFIGTTLVAALAAPVVVVASCGSLLGSNGKYDSVNDNKIVIQSTWSASGAATEALQKVIEKYNATQKGQPGFMEVTLEHVEGGYGTIPSQAITKIQSHDTRTLPNLYIDYPSAVGQITPYEMNYSVSDVLDRNIFIDEFVKVNDKIAGIKAGGMYSVPLAKSTEALAIDKPLMKYIFTQLEMHGATIQKGSSNPIVEEILNQSISSDDKAAIVKQWGAISSNKKTSMVISDSIFNGFEDLFQFINDAQSMFPAPGKPNILGIDSASNSMYALSTLLTQSDPSKFLFYKNKETGYVDFSFLEKGKEQTNIFKDAYSYFKGAIDTGAVWIGGGGAYGSTRLKKHQMAISLSSTAGLNKAYSSDRDKADLNKSETMYALSINKLKDYHGKETLKDVNGKMVDLNKVSATIAQGPSFNTIHINEAENKATKKFLKWFYEAKDKKSEMHSMKPSDFFAKESSYIVPLKDGLDKNSTIGKMVSGKTFNELKNSNDSLIGVKASFEAINREIENVKKNQKLAGVVDLPVDDMTGSIRKIIDSNIAASLNSKNNGASSYTPQQLWDNVHRQAIIDQIVEDDGSLSTEYHYPNMMNRNFSDINWEKFSYVDAEIVSWIDGDTPKVKVINKSNHNSVKSINIGDLLSIRIQGIDTPEAHVKLGDVKYEDGNKLVTFTDAQMKATIDEYKAKGAPLAVYSRGHYNELSTDPKSKYTYWKNIYADIQTKENGDGYDPIEKDQNNPNSTYDLRKVMVNVGKGVKVPLITEAAKREGYWGLKSGEFARKEMPKGAKIRIATDGRKSYNRVVGSIFYGENVSKNWSVEILKKGLTLPFLSNPAAVLDKTSILYHNGLAIADAFNYAFKNKLGIYKLNAGEKTMAEHLKHILSTHGATDYSPLINYGDNKPVGLPTDIYQYIKTRKDDRSLYRNPNERIK